MNDALSPAQYNMRRLYRTTMMIIDSQQQAQLSTQPMTNRHSLLSFTCHHAYHSSSLQTTAVAQRRPKTLGTPRRHHPTLLMTLYSQAINYREQASYHARDLTSRGRADSTWLRLSNPDYARHILTAAATVHENARNEATQETFGIVMMKSKRILLCADREI